MITIDILEKFEDKKGVLVGLIDTAEPLYLGMAPLQTKQENLPYGLSILGAIDDQPSPLIKHTVNKKKVEKLKGNVPKQMKDLELVRDSKPVQIVTAEIANEQLRKYLILQTRADIHYEKIYGYVYKGETYLIGNQGKLLEVFIAERNNYLQKTQQFVKSSKILIQPIVFAVDVIGLNKSFEKNTIVTSDSKIEDISIMSLLRIDNGQKCIDRFKNLLETHTQKTAQSSVSSNPQANIDFLQKLPSQMPNKMVNVHRYLPVELFWQHIRYFCKGRYHFYHYNDEQFNDKGWGCAYRALQTVLSWFNEQRYTDIQILSIRQIQKLLFEIDKSRNLINTSEWIGANEVGWLITKLCKVECKIVYLQDGANIIQKVQIFKHHLETAGTPIMYGGDMYAYTIVGLNYSWETGECLFLIVDPHYTQENTPKQVVSKDGVYWREGSKLFKKGVYYNFCLPQIPM